VRAVPVRVPRARRVHLLLPDRRQVPLVEEPRADQLPVYADERKLSTIIMILITANL
jgi:hypothetical protein